MYLAPLLILLYLLFYANLPDNVNGVTIKALSTAGAIDRFLRSPPSA